MTWVAGGWENQRWAQWDLWVGMDITLHYKNLTLSARAPDLCALHVIKRVLGRVTVGLAARGSVELSWPLLHDSNECAYLLHADLNGILPHSNCGVHYTRTVAVQPPAQVFSSSAAQLSGLVALPLFAKKTPLFPSLMNMPFLL